MKTVYLAIFFSVFLISVNQSYGNDDKAGLVYAKVLNDESLCDDSVPIIVVAPKVLEGNNFRSARFSLNDGERAFSSSLVYRDDLDEDEGVFFCLDKLSLEHVILDLDYGYNDCEGSIHSFRIGNLDKILVEKRVHAKIIKYSGKRVPYK